MSTASTPRPPSGLGTRGRKFWRDTVRLYDFDTAEQQLLVEVCRTLDRLDALEAVVAQDGPTITGSMGQTIVHPAIGEARQQRVVLARLVAALELPTEDGPTSTLSMTNASDKARHAAQARWSRRGSA